jgi:hypothetical protein
LHVRDGEGNGLSVQQGLLGVQVQESRDGARIERGLLD